MSPNFKSANPLALCALLLATALGASGLLSCASTVTSTMAYPRAAEIDVRGKNQIAVIGFNSHRDGSTVRTKLQEKLGESKQFKLVAPGRASLHMKGKVEESYKREDTDSRGAECVASQEYKEDGKTKYRERRYYCTEHIRQAEVRVAMQMEVLNAKNKDILISKRPICEKKERTSSLYDPDLESSGSWLGVLGAVAELAAGDTVTEVRSRSSAPEIDENAMFESCLDEVSGMAAHTIARWTENVSVPLKKDNAVPEFKRAQELADRGAWDEVIEIYEAVSKKPDLSPNSRIRAYLNLGNVQMYHAKEFSAARSSFEKGMELAKSGGKEDCSEKTPRKNCFGARINETKWRAEDWQKLQRQRRSGL